MFTKAKEDIKKFRNLEDLKEYDCIDGYFRYTSGEFSSKKEAYEKAKVINRSGYPYGYVQKVQKYLNASR